MGTPENPTPGDLHIDATVIKPIKYPNEHLNTFTKLRDGYESAIACLVNLTADMRKSSGISGDEVTELVELMAEHKKIAAFHEAAAEMTELLHHTLLDRGHKIATRLAEVTLQVRRRAARYPNGAEILGAVDDLLEYQLGPAQKAMATKAKAKAAASAENGADTGSSHPTP